MDRIKNLRETFQEEKLEKLKHEIIDLNELEAVFGGDGDTASETIQMPL